ncbi:hypothetical protein [Caballeronia sp. M1242]|uniref:hypothetical protein n=1 Tax=Caballeronia sp. M1242 TaxID=2814653 RepID=UPI0019D10012|nr:hypothetical protein [Caballeronia sp. M1242]QSN62031.1 hypothetical protein JYK05_03815 [Caballeronia sp. M1242]
MKWSRALANRELLVFIAIVASAITLHVRAEAIDRSAASAAAAAMRAAYSQLCEPSPHGSTRARPRPADCRPRAHIEPTQTERLWL